MPVTNKPSTDERAAGAGAIELARPTTENTNVQELQELAEASYQIAHLILPKLRESGIPLTPANFRLWYEYYDGDSSELRSTLDQLLADKAPFTPELTQSLFQRFFVLAEVNEHSLILDQAGRKAQSVLSDVLSELGKGAEQVGLYHRGLQENLRLVECELPASGLAPALSDIGRCAGDMAALLNTMRGLMAQSARRLSDLLKRLRERDQLAHIDELTGLYNRRALNLRLREEVSRSNRYGNPFAVIMLDIDDFKPVNDTFGHLVGDRLLAVMGKTIANGIRTSDFAARYGGEEFTVICPETGLEAAARLGERLRGVVDGTEFMVRGRRVKATISGGVAVFRKAEAVDALIDRADRALYLAKNAGKNRVATEEQLIGPADDA